MLISHIISCFIVGYIFKNWKKKNEIKIDYALFKSEETRILKLSDLGEILGDSIKNAISTILTIGGFVVLFSVIISIIETSGILEILCNTLYQIGIPIEFSKSLFSGLLELTNGIKLCSTFFSTNPTICILLISFLLGFGGISIMLQVYSIIAKEEISIKPYFYGKFLQGIFSVFITWILL